MSEFIFELVGDQFRPVLPRKDRVADGVHFFTDNQAAQRTGRPAEFFQQEWISFYQGDEDLVTSPDSAPAALVGLRPTADPVENAKTAARLALIRKIRFPHITDDEHWAFIVDACRRLKVDPTCIWVKLEKSDDTGKMEPKLITTLLILRQIAESTGKKAGETIPQFCGRDGKWTDVWVADEPPAAARAGVLRRDTDQLFEGTAYFRQCANYVRDEKGDMVLTEAWKKGAAPQLGKCALVAAHRAAFHDVIGNLLAREENEPQSLPKFSRESVAGPATSEATQLPDQKPPPAEIHDDPKFAWPFVDETTPDSISGLRRDLLDLLPSKAKADEFIEEFRLKLPRLYNAHLQAFCALVLRQVRENSAACEVADAA